MRAILPTLSSLVAFVLPATAGAPDQIIVDGSRTCRDCRILATKLAVIGRPDDTVVLDPRLGSPAVDSRGRFYFPSVKPPGVLIFDSAGKYLRTLGRKGKGPGELESAEAVQVGTNDSVYVVHAGGIEVYTSDLKTARRIESKGSWAFFVPIRLSDGRFVRPRMEDDKNGAWVEILTPQGLPAGRLSSGSDAASSFRKSPQMATFSIVREGIDGSLWRGRNWAYVVERWTPDNRLATVIVRRNEKMGEWGTTPLDANTPPPPRIIDLQQDSAGLLWVVGGVPGPKWREAYAEYPRSSMPPYPPGIHGKDEGRTTFSNRRLNTRVEVIDPRSGELVATLIIPALVRGFIGKGTIYSFDEDTEGNLSAVAWKVTLERPGARK
jgi:hypothetical protein